MCGILAVAGGKGSFNHRQLFSLRARGPDEVGFWTDSRVRLAQTRLSILGLNEESIAPVENERFVLIYNGEIYNFIDLKSQLGLKQKGLNDAHVLLHAWSQWGLDCLEKLHGFWAFTVYDKLEKTLTIVRDQFGIKPLYYVRNKDQLCVGSTIRSVLGVSDDTPELDYEALSEYARYQFTFGNKTFLKQVRKVLPGEVITFRLSDLTLTSRIYEDIHATRGDEEVTTGWISETKSLLQECILESTISDTSFTTFCSGGLDSSFITRVAQPEVAYHCNYSDPDCNETFYAQRVVEDTPIRLLVVNAQEKFSLVDRLASILRDFDEPTIGSVILPLDNLLEQVKRRYKVILTGTGGDELFAGYVRYMLTLGECNQDNYRGLFNEVRKLETFTQRFECCHRKGNPECLSFFDPAVKETFFSEFDSLSPNDNPLRAMLKFDQKFFLAGLLNIDDKMGGRHSLESRPSFLHQRFVRHLNKVHVDPGSFLEDGELKTVFRTIAGEVLPHSVVHRKDKMGFTTPIGTFVNRSADEIREQITNSPFKHFYELKKINFTAKNKYSREVFGLLMLDLWLAEYLRKPALATSVEQISVHTTQETSPVPEADKSPEPKEVIH